MPSERRLHPYSIIFAFLTQIRMFVVPGVLVLVGASSRGGDWEPWMMLLVIPNAIVAIVRYVSYRYEYEPSELVIRSGLVFRKERHVPYARIQNIDAVQNVLHRLLNVVEVRVETGGGQEAEATMSVLPVSAFREMRERVFADRRTMPADHATFEPELAKADAPATLLQLTTRDLLLYGFIENRGGVVIAAALGLVWEFGLFDRAAESMLGNEVTSGGAMRGLARSFFRGFLAEPRQALAYMQLVVIGLLAVLLGARIVSMIWAAVRLHGFRLTLRGEDLGTEYGLLTRVTATLPRRRIQTLTVREGPLHRLFTRVAVKADTAGGRAEQTGTSADWEWLAPLLPRSALPNFVRQVLPQHELEAVAWQPVAPRAVRRELVGWLFWLGAPAAATAWFIGWWALPLVVLAAAWAMIGARQTVRWLGWATTGDAVLFRSGWIWRRVVVVPLTKIQVVALGENVFDRRTKMASVRVDAAGVSEWTSMEIPYLGREIADTLFVQLSHAAARTQFKW